jgi:hypothetical protein
MSKPLPKNRLATISLNLLPKDKFSDSILGKFLIWSLSIGRYLVILTELVVILTFISRFKLDRDLTDLNEKINAQKQIILSYADMETQFITVQAKTEFIKTQQEAPTGIVTMDFLEKSLPVDMKLSQLNIQATGFTITGSSLSAQSIKRLTTQIAAQYPKTEISLSEVMLNSRTGGIDFTLRLSQPTVAKKSTTKQSTDSGI